APLVSHDYPAWNQVGAVVNVAEGTVLGPPPVMSPTPTIAPVVGGSLRIGGLARIQTTEGDRLNIRSGPGVSFSVVDQAINGATVTILEGPRPADGFTWWRVRLPSGVEGWAVESVDDRGVRLQTLVPLGG
ncbi:MAG: SH3 domain-containing protein, partial [Chloroflexi bacterium]